MLYSFTVPLKDVESSTQRVTTSRMTDERPTILIADDDEAILELLTMILGDDYEILQARDGDEAVQVHAKRKGVDLVLLDMSLGRMSGYDVLASMQRDDPDLRVIVITGMDPDTARLPNVRQIITKPFRVDQVREVVAQELK